MTIVVLAAALAVSAAKPFDFDGDGKTDFGYIRNQQVGPVTNMDWHITRSSDNTELYARFGFGFSFATPQLPADYPTPADFDGDGKTDIGVWRPSPQTGMSVFYILNSFDGTLRVEYFGQQGDDTQAVGDYDGDGRADLAAYRTFERPRKGQFNLFIYRGSLNNPTGSLSTVPLGLGTGSRRYPGDFDGDGKLDFCVRGVSSGTFTLVRSSDLQTETINLGAGPDRPVAGDFDGDGRSDFCVVREAPTRWEWTILERDGGGTGTSPIVWGIAGPGSDGCCVAGDYDGDGKTDIGVTRYASSSFWYFVKRSSNGSLMATPTAATTGDIFLQPFAWW